MNKRGLPDRNRRSMITEISPDQARSFAILRRPEEEGDRLPQSTFDRGGLELRGLNPALARRAVTGLGDLWVVPGNGHIALYDGSATCSPTDWVVDRGMVMWGSARRNDHVVVQGLVPDGVSQVTLITNDEGSTTGDVVDNVYATEMAGSFKLGRFDGPIGRVEFGPAARRL